MVKKQTVEIPFSAFNGWGILFFYLVLLAVSALCVWRAADTMVEWLLEQEGMEGVRSINPVVGETNDGGLNQISFNLFENFSCLKDVLSSQLKVTLKERYISQENIQNRYDNKRSS